MPKDEASIYLGTLSNNTDLNNLGIGKYIKTSAVTGIINSPVSGSSFVIETRKIGPQYIQYIYVQDGTMFYRIKWSSNWLAWNKFSTT